VLPKAILNGCLLTNVTDPLYPNGYVCSYSQIDNVAKHMLLAFQQCPDVRDTLPYSWNQ
jgi:hypothetical protein